MLHFLELTSYSTVCWRPGKLGYVDVVAPLTPTETTQLPPALDSIATPVALVCIKQPKQELALWLSWKGYRDFKKTPKAFHSVLHVCSDDTKLGVFYTQHHGGDLSFALVEHAKGVVEKLVGSPRLYATELAALMNDVVPMAERKLSRKTSKSATYFEVRHATLRLTTQGYVVAAVVAVGGSDLYGVVGDLEANVWRKSKLRNRNVDAKSTFSLFISPTGSEARFVQCDVGAPVDPDAALPAPNISLALSTFERVSTTDAAGATVDGRSTDGGATSPPLSSSRALCAVLRECVLPTRIGTSVVERCFQSYAFPRNEGGKATHYRCLSAVEDKSTPVFTIVIDAQTSSYVVHVSYARGGGDLVASATEIPELRLPICVCGLRVPTHPHRPNGTTLSLVLCRDMKLYACEHFGQSAAVVLRIGNLLSSVVTFPFPPQLKPPKRLTAVARGADAAADVTRLIAVRDSTEVMCTNGVVGVFFRVSMASLQITVPAVTRATIAADPAEHLAPELNVGGEDGCVGAASLRQCLAKLEELSLRTARHDLPEVVFRDVIPLLRHVGTSQQEVMLIQRVYEQLLHMAEPNLQSEWNYVWALTSVVQRTLAKRNKENRVLYTDAFFVRLADTYRHSDFASLEGVRVVEEAVRAGVSDEAARVLTAQPPHLPPEVCYVMDGLADGVSPIDLAEEVARRMVHTSTLSNGTCVVSTHSPKAECVHGMGCVLLASCLDLNVWVCAQEGCEMRVCAQPPPQRESADAETTASASGTTCVAVPPYAFASQDEFEKALTLASDLLCVSTADASFRPDVALLSLAIGTRQHCLTAFMQLFAPILRVTVEEMAPLANNTVWIEACAAVLSRSFEEQATALFGSERSSSMSLSTTLLYVLYAPQQMFNKAFFHTLSSTLSEEFCTTALVTCVFHQTECLVAAVHNYAAAVATYMLKRTDAEREGSWQAVQVGKHRLHSVLAQTHALWAHMGPLSSYQVQDIAASYRVSVRNSLVSSLVLSSAAGDTTTAAQAARGTVVSRTVVACFRLLCLVQCCCDMEDNMEEPLVVDGLGRNIDSFTKAVQALYLLRESPLPLEWFQRSFVSLVQRAVAATLQPTWTAYFVRLLQLSNVCQTGNASLKKEFYGLLDGLQAQLAQHINVKVTKEDSEEVQRAITAAESAVAAMTLLEEVPEQPQQGSGAIKAPLSSATAVQFIFSATRDPSLPRWTNSHSLQEQRYLFSHEWTSALWMLERAPEALLDACERTVARIEHISFAAESDVAASSLSAEMAGPLFAHLCRLRPPVRLHALATSSDATSAVQRKPKPTAVATTAETPAAVQVSAVVTPEKLHAPRATPPTPVAAAPNDISIAAALVVSHPSAALPPSSSSALRVEGAAAPALTTAAAPTAQVQTVAASPELHGQQIKGASTHSGLYAPADVAWWDSIALPDPTSCSSPPKEVATLTATGDENGESSDTATSYTTSTSTYADPMETLGEFGKKWSRSCRDRKGVVYHGNSRTDVTDTGYGDRCHGASSRSPPCCRSFSKKKCHCCHRVMQRHSSCQSCGRGKDARAFDDAATFSLKWKDGALETEVAPLRPPPMREAVTTRPALLSFTTRLQPPEEPERPFAQTARPSFPSHPCNLPSAAPALVVPDQVALLRLPTSSALREPSRVHLYTLRGERVEAADSRDAVSLHRFEASRGVLFGKAAPLTAPAVPPSSVFVAPPALLRLPPQGSAQQEAAATVAAPPDVTSTTSQAYPQATRAPVGPEPPAIDLSTLHNPSANMTPQLQHATDLEKTAAPTSTTLPVPVPPPAAPAGVLESSQLADFHRYTNDLLARHAVPAVSQVSATAAATTPPPAAPASVNAHAEGEVPADCPGVARLIQQQDDFIRKAAALMQSRQAENESFYRRVVESIRSLTSASQQLRGLTPMEQSQLVRDTVKQRNELMGLNHQLLEMQLAAARVGGEIPSSAPQSRAAVSLSTPSAPSLAAAGTTQAAQVTHAPPSSTAARSSAGVSWAAPVAAASLASVPTQTPAVPKMGMEGALSDLQRLNAELIGVSASAEAMDKAIKETREVIQRYERTKTAEALAAEGVALTAAMRMRTAAIEQRLTELPRRAPQPTAASSSSMSRGWTVQSSPLLEADGTEGKPDGQSPSLAGPSSIPTSGPQTVSNITANAAASSPRSHFTAEAELTDVESDAKTTNTVQQQQQQTQPTLSTALVAVSSPSRPPSRSSPAFTSVSSTPLADTVAAASTDVDVDIDAASPRASSARTRPASAGARHHSHSGVSTHEERSNTGRRTPTSTPVQAHVYTQPRDLRTFFAQAGGVAHAGAHTLPNVSVLKRPAGQSLERRAPSLRPRPVSVQRVSNNTTGARHTPADDRYAMYRMPAQPSKRIVVPTTGPSSCLPLSYAQESNSACGVSNIKATVAPAPPVDSRRCPVGDAYADRQRDRRIASIAHRMQQLEHDLFD